MQFEILEGTDPSSYMLFTVVTVRKEESAGQPFWKEIEERENERNAKDTFSIEEEAVSDFLAYFLWKYFDPRLSYNQKRKVDDRMYSDEFEWHGFNYYTNDSMEQMCDEIWETAKLLRQDYENPDLAEVKERFLWYLSEEPRAIENIVGFYRRFVKRMRRLIKEYSRVGVIVVIGP